MTSFGEAVPTEHLQAPPQVFFITPLLMHTRTEAPNHALQPTGVHVTSAASTAAFPPAAQPPRHARPWLSLGSLGFRSLVR